MTLVGWDLPKMSSTIPTISSGFSTKGMSWLALRVALNATCRMFTRGITWYEAVNDQELCNFAKPWSCKNEGINLGEYNTLDVINPNGLKTTRLAHVCTWDVPPNKMAKLLFINAQCIGTSCSTLAYLSNYRTSLPLNLSMPVIVPDSMLSLMYISIYHIWNRTFIHPIHLCICLSD
jgi:hypothetical protein